MAEARGDAVGGALDWMDTRGRVLGAGIVAFGAALFAAAQSSFLWSLDLQPDDVGGTTPSLVGRAVLGLLVALFFFYLVAIVITVALALCAVIGDALADVPQGWREAQGRGRTVVVVLLLVGAVAAVVATPMAGLPYAIGLGILPIGLAVNFLAVGVAEERDRPPIWHLVWTGGLTGAMAVLVYFAVTNSFDSAAETLLSLLLAGIGLAVGAVAGVRSWRARVGTWLEPRRFAITGVTTLTFSAVAVSVYAGASARFSAGSVRAGNVPKSLEHALVGWPVQCVEIRWLDGEPPADVDGTFVRLGASDGRVVLYKPGHGAYRLPEDRIITVPVPDETCSSSS